MMYLPHLPLVATLLSVYRACYAFVPKAFNVESHHSVRGSQLFASKDAQEVAIIGGGVAGLSIAHYLATKPDSNLKVTLYDRETPEQQLDESKSESASVSAAGYLGVQLLNVEGRLLSICEKSREMYDDWLKKVEAGAQNAAAESLRKLDCFLPKFAVDEAGLSFGEGCTRGREQAKQSEPRLADEVESWSLLEDLATIDAQSLLCSLRAACAGAGVQMNLGEKWAVKSLEKNGDGECTVNLADGSLSGTRTVVVANGAFLNVLMDGLKLGTVPIQAKEGQSFVMRTSDGTPFMEKAVLSKEAYILPKSDGRVLVGDTLGGLGSGDTIANVKKLVSSEALDALKDKQSFTVARPMTADCKPILGKMANCDNLYVAGGYNNYGLLIAPKAAKLIGDLILNNGKIGGFGDEDKKFLEAFSPDRVVDSGWLKPLSFAP